MKIGIITDFMDDTNRAGIGHYVYYLVKELLKVDTENEYWLIHNKRSGPPDAQQLYRDSNELFMSPPPLFSRIWKYGLFPLSLNKHNFDIIHYPSALGPFLLNPRTRYKKIITIYDLRPLLYREAATRREYLIHKYILPRIARNADRIVTDSENSAREILEFLHVPQRKIAVVYDGVDLETFKPLDDVSEVDKKYNLHFPFILTVCSIGLGKNLSTLIRAFRALKEQHFGHKMVLVGKRVWGYRKVIETVRELNLEGEVVLLGYVPDKDLPGLYNAAQLFVYPSIYEGFPLPPLEAMACGTPVITSNTSSFPEVIEGAGVMVAPYNVNGWTENISRVLADKKLMQELSQKGLQKARMFTWKDSAQKMLRIYQEICNE